MPGEQAIARWGLKRQQLYTLLVQAILVASFLFVCRMAIMHELIARNEPPAPLHLFLTTARRFGPDALAVSAVFFAAGALARLSWRASFLWMIAAGAALLLAAAANVRVVLLYGQPATRTLIEFAGLFDLRAIPTFFSYATAADRALLAGAAGGVALLLAAPLLVRRWIEPVRPARLGVAAAAALAVLAAPWLALQSHDEFRRIHANPAWVLVRTFALSPTGRIVSVSDPDAQDPFETYRLDGPPILAPEAAAADPPRNVVIVVLESVASQYIDARRWPERTPNIAAMLPHSAYFPNAYVPLSGSWPSLFGLTTSRYPPITESYPSRSDLKALPNLFDELTARGLRGGAFLSADWGYSGHADYFAGRGLDRIVMAPRSGGCVLPTVSGRGYPTANAQRGGSDSCTFEAFARWAGQSDRPYFAILWTDQTHYPYRHAAVAGADTSSNRDNYRRFLLALQETDRLIGRLVAGLREQGDLQDSLIVIVGDHGEAFGQHGTVVHGIDTFDESVRVPLIFFNERLFAGTTSPEPVRLIDVAPTVLGLLGAASPPQFQGLDLSGPLRPKRAFFAAWFFDINLGYAEAERKFIYYPEADDLLVFDLSRNPGEDLARRLALSPAERQRAKWTIMNWRAVADASYAVP